MPPPPPPPPVPAQLKALQRQTVQNKPPSNSGSHPTWFLKVQEQQRQKLWKEQAPALLTALERVHPMVDPYGQLRFLDPLLPEPSDRHRADQLAQHLVLRVRDLREAMDGELETSNPASDSKARVGARWSDDAEVRESAEIEALRLRTERGDHWNFLAHLLRGQEAWREAWPIAGLALARNEEPSIMSLRAAIKELLPALLGCPRTVPIGNGWGPLITRAREEEVAMAEGGGTPGQELRASGQQVLRSAVSGLLLLQLHVRVSKIAHGEVLEAVERALWHTWKEEAASWPTLSPLVCALIDYLYLQALTLPRATTVSLDSRQRVPSTAIAAFAEILSMGYALPSHLPTPHELLTMIIYTPPPAHGLGSPGSGSGSGQSPFAVDPVLSASHVDALRGALASEERSLVGTLYARFHKAVVELLFEARAECNRVLNDEASSNEGSGGSGSSSSSSSAESEKDPEDYDGDWLDDNGMGRREKEAMQDAMHRGSDLITMLASMGRLDKPGQRDDFITDLDEQLAALTEILVREAARLAGWSEHRSLLRDDIEPAGQDDADQDEDEPWDEDEFENYDEHAANLMVTYDVNPEEMLGAAEQRSRDGGVGAGEDDLFTRTPYDFDTAVQPTRGFLDLNGPLYGPYERLQEELRLLGDGGGGETSSLQASSEGEGTDPERSGGEAAEGYELAVNEGDAEDTEEYDAGGEGGAMGYEEEGSALADRLPAGVAMYDVLYGVPPPACRAAAVEAAASGSEGPEGGGGGASAFSFPDILPLNIVPSLNYLYDNHLDEPGSWAAGPSGEGIRGSPLGVGSQQQAAADLAGLLHMGRRFAYQHVEGDSRVWCMQQEAGDRFHGRLSAVHAAQEGWVQEVPEQVLDTLQDLANGCWPRSLDLWGLAEALAPSLASAHPRTWAVLLQAAEAEADAGSAGAAALAGAPAEEVMGDGPAYAARRVAAHALLGLASVQGLRVPAARLHLAACVAAGAVLQHGVQMSEEGSILPSHPFAWADATWLLLYLVYVPPTPLLPTPEHQWVSAPPPQQSPSGTTQPLAAAVARVLSLSLELKVTLPTYLAAAHKEHVLATRLFGCKTDALDAEEAEFDAMVGFQASFESDAAADVAAWSVRGSVHAANQAARAARHRAKRSCSGPSTPATTLVKAVAKAEAAAAGTLTPPPTRRRLRAIRSSPGGGADLEASRSPSPDAEASPSPDADAVCPDASTARADGWSGWEPVSLLDLEDVPDVPGKEDAEQRTAAGEAAWVAQLTAPGGGMAARAGAVPARASPELEDALHALSGLRPLGELPFAEPEPARGPGPAQAQASYPAGLSAGAGKGLRDGPVAAPRLPLVPVQPLLLGGSFIQAPAGPGQAQPLQAPTLGPGPPGAAPVHLRPTAGAPLLPVGDRTALVRPVAAARAPAGLVVSELAPAAAAARAAAAPLADGLLNGLLWAIAQPQPDAGIAEPPAPSAPRCERGGPAKGKPRGSGRGSTRQSLEHGPVSSALAVPAEAAAGQQDGAGPPALDRSLFAWQATDAPTMALSVLALRRFNERERDGLAPAYVLFQPESLSSGGPGVRMLPAVGMMPARPEHRERFFSDFDDKLTQKVYVTAKTKPRDQQWRQARQLLEERRAGIIEVNATGVEAIARALQLASQIRDALVEQGRDLVVGVSGASFADDKDREQLKKSLNKWVERANAYLDLQVTAAEEQGLGRGRRPRVTISDMQDARSKVVKYTAALVELLNPASPSWGGASGRGRAPQDQAAEQAGRRAGSGACIEVSLDLMECLPGQPCKLVLPRVRATDKLAKAMLGGSKNEK